MSALFEHVKIQVASGISSGQYIVGDVLPPVGELADEYGCSVGTVERALSELASAGVLKRVRKKGTIVARRPPLGRVCLLLSHDDHTNMLLQHVLFETLHKAGFDVEVASATVADNVLEQQVRQICERAETPPILVSLDERRQASQLKVFNELFDLRIAFGFSNGVRASEGEACIGPDLRDMSRQVAKHLLGLGHKNIAVVCGYKSEPATAWPRFTAETLKDMIEMAGGQCFLHYLNDGQDGLLRLIREDKVTAYWALNDHEAMCWETRLLREGIQVPDEVSIIGRWNTPWASEAPTPLTSPSIDSPAVARAIADMAKKLVQGKAITGPVAVPPKLIERDSTIKAPSGRKRKIKA